MRYDFTTHVDRRGQGSSKWEDMLSENPNLPEGVVPLSVADMELENPPEVRRALHELIDAGPLGYTQPTERFFSACLGWQAKRHDWEPRKEWIVTTPGVVPALFKAVEMLTEPGDGVIIQPPVYYPFRMSVETNGRTLVENPLSIVDGRYEMDFDDLAAKAADPANKMLILCSPHNPVGRVWTAEELRRLIDICMENDVLIVADEIHDDLIMPGNTHTTLMRLMSEEERNRAIVCTAPSKTFNLAGVQGSVIYVPDEELRLRLQAGFGSSGLNIFAYTATTAAYEECGEWLDQLLELIQDNFRHLESWAAKRHPELRVFPLEGTYLAWVDFNAWGMDGDALERFMKDEALLWLDEGKLFGTGGEGFERFNLACPTDVLDAALARLDAAWGRRCANAEGGQA